MTKRVFYYISISLLMFSHSIFAQDSISKTKIYPLKSGFTIGFNLVDPIVHALNTSLEVYEFSVNAGTYKNFSLTGEFGFLNNRIDSTDQYFYIAKGTFIRFGADYNIYKKNNKDENNMIYVGLRYGFSKLNHEANDILIKDSFWGNKWTNFPSQPYTTQFVELTGGLKVELVWNIYMGWSVSYRLATSKIGNISPFQIPGFGKGSNSDSWGFNYSIYYFIPFTKKQPAN
jgi:hypothetical protein